MDAVISAGELEDSAEFGFARELWFVMENHPSTIPDVAAYGSHPETAVRYLVMLSVAETLEWHGHTFNESTLAEHLSRWFRQPWTA